MKVNRITAYVVKIPHHDRFGGQVAAPNRLGSSDYYFEDEWQEVYAVKTQSTLVRVQTDDGVHGWGECQAPIVPEASAEVIAELLGPMLLGADPRETEVNWGRMYKTMNTRGHFTGFMVDAMSGLDMAMWDIKAKLAGEPLARLLGGRPDVTLPAYVSGLRAGTTEQRAELAARYFDEGYEGVKLFIGRGVDADAREAQAIRERVPGCRVFTDVFWVYNVDQAISLGRRLEEVGVGWMEAPLAPEDVAGHAEVARALDLPIAVGEPLRSPFDFEHWLTSRAMDIAQPDVVRCGITGSRRIANLALVHHTPIAYHLGVCLGIGMAATWHLAAATPNMLIQEHEPPMLDLSNTFLEPGLVVDRGRLCVPQEPGLGVDVNLERLSEFVTRILEVN